MCIIRQFYLSGLNAKHANASAIVHATCDATTDAKITFMTVYTALQSQKTSELCSFAWIWLEWSKSV